MAFLVFFTITIRAQVTGVVKTNDQMGQPQAPQPDVTTLGNGINYNGGRVMPGPHNVYFIWYGNWNGNSATALLPAFISGLNGSAYFNTNTTYGDNSSNITNTISMVGQSLDNYSQKLLLTDDGLKSVVSSKLLSGSLPTDANGIYFVLSSADVDQNSSDPKIGRFCVKNCGFHNHALMNGADIKYAFVGNPDRCPLSCERQQSNSPNGNPGADAMASTIAHELNETVTDPDLNAWFDSFGQEVGDKCNNPLSFDFTFGPTFTTSNGSQANMILNGKNFLVQQNWVNGGGGFCAMSLFLAEPLFNLPLF
ncbi:MAG TPA: hypothetical protein VG759_11315, partial [Candidatus Angelobacter sp.]|nr:hypothetical protein [Candidatus Angelobacter sp.]